MKPKKGETNNEMDEPMKNPLQLVKDLVLLIVEARTPDFTVKGRIEGPHCPIIRGRPAHKCSTDKVECVRANEFCCLAQRLWLNSIPVCLDILLFPDCIHGREEASVTEGAVTSLSLENSLLIERWIIDWSKRRQDDCLSSSMLIQAVRSYLHFSQISSWLYSTCGRLPGRLAYRVYAPGEVTSLEFSHPPDIHSFPVCLVNFHHIRVKVSSLQRQASVPILVCLQDETLTHNTRRTHHGKRSKCAKFKTKQEHAKEFASVACFTENPWCFDKLQATSPVAVGYSTSALTVTSGTKSVKSLHPLDTSQLVYEDQLGAMCGPTYTVRNSLTYTKTGNVIDHFEALDNLQPIDSAEIVAGKAKSLARVMVSDGGGDVEVMCDSITRTYGTRNVSCINEYVDRAVSNLYSPMGIDTSDLHTNRIKSSQKMDQVFKNHELLPRTSSKKASISLGDKNRGWNITTDKKQRHAKTDRDGKINFNTKQVRPNYFHSSRETTNYECCDDNEHAYSHKKDDDDDGDLIVSCTKVSACPNVKGPQMQTEIEKSRGLHVAGVKKLSQKLLINDADNRVEKKLSGIVSHEQMFVTDQSFTQKNISPCSQAGLKGKIQAKQSNDICQKGATEDKVIKMLSHKLSEVMVPDKKTFALSKPIAESQKAEMLTGNTALKGMLLSGDTETDGLLVDQQKLTASAVRKHLDQNTVFSQLTIDVSKLSDTFEDSDDTPVASPNQMPQSRSTPETLVKTVAGKSIKQNLYWLQKNTCSTDHIEASSGWLHSAYNSDQQLSGMTGNGCVSESSLGKNHIAPTETSAVASSRRMFEENLLPLVSYDADSDSFRKVDDFLSCNVLHSPKVLFSCDLPNTKTTSSKKCIDFSDTFEAEFFKSKISDLVNPEAIGKYMSQLALLSNASTNSKEDHDDDVPVDNVQMFDDLVTADIMSNVDMSSNMEHSLKQAQGEQTRTQSTGLQATVCNYLDKYSKTGHEGQHHETKCADADSAMQVLSNENCTKHLMNNDCFPQTRRQLYSDVESAPSVLKRKTVKRENIMESLATLVVPPVCDTTCDEHCVQAKIEFQVGRGVEITDLKGPVISLPSEKIALQMSPLSSSCSSSSSSSSTASVQKRSVPLSPPSSSVLSPANTHEALDSEKDNEEVNSVLNVQESPFIYCPTQTSIKPLGNLVHGNPTTTAAIITGSREKLETDFQSKPVTSSTTQSLNVANIGTVVFAPDPLILAPSTSSSQSSASSISKHLLPSSCLSSQIQNDANRTDLCHNSTPSLFKYTVPQPLPQDFDSGPDSHFQSEPTSSKYCNQNNYVHNPNSHSISDAKSGQCVPKLCPEHAKHLCHLCVTACDCVTSCDCDDHQKYILSSKTKVLESTLCQSVPVAPITLEAVTELDNLCQEDGLHDIDNLDSVTELDQLCQEDGLHDINSLDSVAELDQLCQEDGLPDNTVLSCDPLKSCQRFSKDNTESDDGTDVQSRTSAKNIKAEPSSSSPLEMITVGNILSNKNVDNSIIKVNKSVISSLNSSSQSLHNETSDIVLLNKVSLSSNEKYANLLVSPSKKEIASEVFSLSQEQSEPIFSENCNSVWDLSFQAESQNEEVFDEVFHSSVIDQLGSRCASKISYQKATDMKTGSDALLQRDPGVNEQHDNMHLKSLTLKVIQTGQDSKSGFQVEDNSCNEDKDINDSGWNSDVVFYLSDPDTKMRTDQPMSALSSSLKEVISREACKAIRPSSLSAEVNLEIKLRSNLGVKDKTELDFSTHSRSPPFLSDPPGWSSVPPHRTVSTPSGMDRQSRSKEERASANISVIQQHNCDNTSQTGLRRMAAKSASMIFNNRTGLPTQSSPAPLKRKSGGRFEYDVSLLNTRGIKNAFSCSKLASGGDSSSGDTEEMRKQTLSTSAPASTNCLLGNFEESILNGRIDPVGTVDGFSAEVGASGSFCPKHVHLPVSAFFFALSDDNAPSPYLGYISLESIGKKGYHIPRKGTVQVTLFNPNKMVVKMFVVVYDLSDMPPSSQTFIRQRTVYSPVDRNHPAPSYLRYLIHLRCASSHSGKIYLHTDIRLIFARQKLDIDAKTIPYELKSYTEGPQNPKYSPKK